MDERPFRPRTFWSATSAPSRTGSGARRSAELDGTWKRGVGLASQVWYGGGGPPSYAWVRVGADARVTVVTAMQDIGTGSATAMAQIAAEELGLPIDHVEVSLGDTARAVRDDLRRIVDDSLDGAGSSLRCRRRRPPDHRDRSAAPRPRAAFAVPEGRPDRLLRRRLMAPQGDHRPARGRADPRPGLAWPEPGRHADADLRSTGRRGRRRRRDGRGACRARSPRSTTSAA